MIDPADFGPDGLHWTYWPSVGVVVIAILAAAIGLAMYKISR